MEETEIVRKSVFNIQYYCNDNRFRNLRQFSIQLTLDPLQSMIKSCPWELTAVRGVHR